MITLEPVGGIVSLIEYSFMELGGVHRVLGLFKIKGLIRKGDFAEAIESCTWQIQNSRKVKFWNESGNHRDPIDIELRIGELLYGLGGEMAAIELILFPAACKLLEQNRILNAHGVLERILRVHPECEEAQALLNKLGL